MLFDIFLTRQNTCTKVAERNGSSYYSVVILVSTCVGYIRDDMSGEVSSDIEVTSKGYNVKEWISRSVMW